MAKEKAEQKFKAGQKVAIDAKHGKWGTDNTATVDSYKENGRVLVKVPGVEELAGFNEADLVAI